MTDDRIKRWVDVSIESAITIDKIFDNIINSFAKQDSRSNIIYS